MSLQEQLQHVHDEYPEVWEYMQEIRESAEEDGFYHAMAPELPTFDDNDEVIHYVGGHYDAD